MDSLFRSWGAAEVVWTNCQTIQILQNHLIKSPNHLINVNSPLAYKTYQSHDVFWNCLKCFTIGQDSMFRGVGVACNIFQCDTDILHNLAVSHIDNALLPSTRLITTTTINHNIHNQPQQSQSTTTINHNNQSQQSQ